jgi:hypothetical protein
MIDQSIKVIGFAVFAVLAAGLIIQELKLGPTGFFLTS